jgi:tRNA pseudouridine55 synthase
LDPNATGLLMMLMGKGTKLSSQVMGGDKTYTGVFHLGIVTASQDCDGEVLANNPWEHITREQVEAQMKALTGDIFQVPPMVSAIKVDGVPLYKLARKGEEVERKKRFVHIYRFTLTEWHPPLVSFEVICTKGTYVRTLAHDIGEALGCGASLDVLRRTHSGDFDVAGAIPYKDLQGLSLAQLDDHILPYERFAVRV